MVTDVVVDADCRALRGRRQLAFEKREDFLTIMLVVDHTHLSVVLYVIGHWI